MLIELRIENFGIIESARFRPGEGFTVITGETGAGKSLLLQAMEAVLGIRIGAGVVRNGTPRAVVEAIFDISRFPGLVDSIRENRISSGDSYLTVRREIPVEGRGRVTVNGTPVTLGNLRGITGGLLEIHGQHENQKLLDPESHLDSLDHFSGTLADREEVSELFYRYASLKKRWKAVTMESGERTRRLDYIKFALQEIAEFEPSNGEYEELEHTRAVIKNSGKLFRDLAGSYSLLREEDGSVLDRLVNVESLLEEHASLSTGLEEKLSLLRDARYGLEDFSDFLRDEKDRMQFSPERLEDVEERIEGYKKLFKKYGGSTGTILAIREDFQRELSSIEMSDEELDLLKTELELVYFDLHAKAESLSRKRQSAIPVLEQKVAREMAELGMQGARLKVSVKRELDPSFGRNGDFAKIQASSKSGAGVTGDNPEVLDEFGNCPVVEKDSDSNQKRYLINEKGLDRVEFLLQANAGEKIQPLRKVASGGELSRIMLAIKSIIMENKPAGTVIFDEVDTGVGGEVAHAIGDRLRSISLRSQVLAVTHLHQIAGSADQHFRIYKYLKDGRTITHIQGLSGDQRIKEMARMLGGEKSGRAVLEHARQILSEKAG